MTYFVVGTIGIASRTIVLGATRSIHRECTRLQLLERTASEGISVQRYGVRDASMMPNMLSIGPAFGIGWSDPAYLASELQT